MAFPVTLNGRTYTLADFQGTKYVDGLPDAFEDFVTQAGNIYTTTSTSSVAIGTGSKTFTVADSAKPYIVGTPLRISDSAAPSTNWIDAVVTSYSGTTLVVDALAYAGSGTIAAWNINIGGSAVAYTGTLPIAQGGSGATTAAAARTNFDVYSKSEADSRFLNVSGEASDVTINGDLTVDTNTFVVDGTNNRVGIGTVSPSANLEIDAGGAASTSLQMTTSGSGHNFDMTDSGGTARIRQAGGLLRLDADLNNEAVDSRIQFEVGGTERARIDSSGNVGIGTGSPQTNLHIEDGGGSTIRLTRADTATISGNPLGRIEFAHTDTDDAGIAAMIEGAGDGGTGEGRLEFHTGTPSALVERMRIDSSGSVGIGSVFSSETIDSTLHVASPTPEIRIEDTNNGIGGTAYTPKLTFDANGDEVGSIGYVNGNLDITTENINSSEIRFFAGGSNRMDIDSSGTVGIGHRVEIGGDMSFVDDSQHLKISATARRLFDGYRATSSTGADMVRIYSDVGATGSLCLLIEADGDVTNTNNSYGAISDERYKQDIVDAQSQWDDIKSLEIKNYRLKDMVEQCGDEAPVHLGVIAQQLEAAGMNGLVNTKVDEETGIETKSVKYSVLYMKAIGALQEAMERIEALEAEIAALKAN